MFLRDGAAWIWELARTPFPAAIRILDFYLLMEYRHELSQLLDGTFRAPELCYGSGVVEAGCKAVIGPQLKQSGRRATAVGAANILALRCALLIHRWDECWDQINHSRPFQAQFAA